MPSIETRKSNIENAATVLYDGHCEFCRRSVALLRRLDWLHRLTFADAHRPDNLPPGQPALEPGRLLEEMHLVTPDGRRVYHGFQAIRWIAWRLPLLWPVAPFLYLPGMTRLGQRVYLWIARHRFQLVPCHGGVCTVANRGEAVDRATKHDTVSPRAPHPSPSPPRGEGLSFVPSPPRGEG